jgi:hypothetical protein
VVEGVGPFVETCADTSFSTNPATPILTVLAMKFLRLIGMSLNPSLREFTDEIYIRIKIGFGTAWRIALLFRHDPQLG